MKPRALLLALTLLWLVPATACKTAPGGALEGPVDPGGGAGTLVVANPTADTWDLRINDGPRGSVAPRSEARISSLRAGTYVLVANNVGLGLEQRAEVTVAYARAVTHTLRPIVTRLSVDNPHDVAIEVTVDGVIIGQAAPRTVTVFEAVPAGKRVLVARAPTGPGAVRVERRLAPDGESAWTIPELAETGPAISRLPKPPEGMGLVFMRNQSRFPVNVYVAGVDQGLVGAGATTSIVLPPGTHKLEVKIEGIDARTEHTVTLRPNQTAEWVWGSESGP